jgi:hypothetical protein
VLRAHSQLIITGMKQREEDAPAYDMLGTRDNHVCQRMEQRARGGLVEVRPRAFAYRERGEEA